MTYQVNVQVLRKTIEEAKNSLEKNYNKSLEAINNRTAEYYHYNLTSTYVKIYPWNLSKYDRIPEEFRESKTEIIGGWFGKKLEVLVEQPNWLENRKQWIADNLSLIKEGSISDIKRKVDNYSLKLSKLEFKLEITEEPLYITEEELNFLFDVVNQKPLTPLSE